MDFYANYLLTHFVPIAAEYCKALKAMETWVRNWLNYFDKNFPIDPGLGFETGIYMFNVTNGNNKTICGICLKLTIHHYMGQGMDQVNFLKVAFHNFYLVHSWISWPISFWCLYC